VSKEAATHLKYSTVIPRAFPHHALACKYARESKRESAHTSEQERESVRERERGVCGERGIEGESESEGGERRGGQEY